MIELTAVAPMATFWASFNSLLSITKYLNQIRDQVISGHDNGGSLSVDHRDAMRLDWIFLVVAGVLGAFTFAGCIYWVSHYVSLISEENSMPTYGLDTVMRVIAAVEVAYGVLLGLACCKDHKVMTTAICQSRDAESDS